MRAALESLLRARKLDVTLTATPDSLSLPPERLAPVGRADVDAALDGGLRRGHLSEITGAPSSGRTLIAVQAMAAAAARGEAVALVDSCDTFDPASAAAHRLALPRLLWVRPSTSLGTGPSTSLGTGPSTSLGTGPSTSLGTGPSSSLGSAGEANAARALKAFSLILQAGGFGLVVLDLADVPAPTLRRFPLTTWMRVARIIEGSDTVALLVVRERIARSAGGVTIALESPVPPALSSVEGSIVGGPVPARWQGTAHRARVFTGVDPAPRVIKARG
jgi:recombination protein RecA